MNRLNFRKCNALNLSQNVLHNIKCQNKKGKIGSQKENPYLFVRILECEIKGLGRKIPNNINDIASPKAKETLFFVDTSKTVDESFILLVFGDMF